MSNHERQGPPPSTGDAGLEHAWRQASDESPPPSLDAAIVAAAREAVANPVTAANIVHGRFGARRWLASWQPIAAAAAVAGLAFTLVQTLPREPRATDVPLRIESVGGSSAEVQTQIQSAPARQKAVDGLQENAVEAAVPAAGAAADGDTANVTPPASVTSAPEAPAEQPGLSSFPSDASASMGQQATATTQRAASRPAAPTTVAGSVAEAVANPAAERRRSDDATRLSAQDQVAKLVALHAAGDLAGATTALREFRAAVEDADRYLPEALRDWAATVHPVPSPE